MSMASRPQIVMDPASAPRPSARVARVASILDCAESDVRRLVRGGELQSHKQGKRGVRIFLDSVREYQDRRTKQSQAEALMHKPRARAAAASASFRAAMARLSALGLL